MYCLVTGGAGFIGSHLVDRLLAEGHQVCVIDNFSTGRPENLAHHQGHADLRLIEGDLNDPTLVHSVLEGVDWVFHLAALADIVPSIQAPHEYHQANVNATLALLEACRKAEIKRFVYAASSSCYGIPDLYPTPEKSPIQPKYPYALTKYVAECYVMHWAELYNLPALSLRLFNVYGPRSRTSGTYGAVFGVFLAQKLANKPFTIVGDGTQSRDFTFVTDVADAFYCAAHSDLVGEIMNVGSGNHYSVNRLVELLGGPITHIPKRPGEPDCTFADTAKIARLLNWKAKVSFEEGVQNVLDEIDYWKQAPVWTTETIQEETQDWFKYLGDKSA